jgi:hypothetical protein
MATSKGGHLQADQDGKEQHRGQEDEKGAHGTSSKKRYRISRPDNKIVRGR